MKTYVLLAACIENAIVDPPSGLDSGGSSLYGPGTADEECNGLDDDGDGEVDEGFEDADGNGRVDCLDVECPAMSRATGGVVDVVRACEVGNVLADDPWDVVVERRYEPGGGSVAMPAVGILVDLDGDGATDLADPASFALPTSRWALAIVPPPGADPILVPGFEFRTGGAVADIDGDGALDVVAALVGDSLATGDSPVAALDGAGNTKWISTAQVIAELAQITVADLDADGQPEVIADSNILNGEDGSTVAILQAFTECCQVPVVADLDGDGTMEIIIGDRVVDGTGHVLWESGPARDASFAAVIDADGDPGWEVMFVDEDGAYLHDDDGTLLATYEIPGGIPGPPCAADVDGDGQVEVVIPAQDKMTALRVDGSQAWSIDIADTSSRAGCSAFDFDADGAYEVLFVDHLSFTIFDGHDGSPLFVDSSIGSPTALEYPVVADIDRDGSAEIILSGSGPDTAGVSIYGHATDGWPAAGPSWGVHDFTPNRLNPDGTVPRVPDPSWPTWNLFRARPPVDDRWSADLAVSFDDACIADCTYGPVEVSIGVANQGDRDLDAGVKLELWANGEDGPRLMKTVTLPAIPRATQLEGMTVSLTVDDLAPWGWYAIVDPDDVVHECDETNNRADWIESYCH